MGGRRWAFESLGQRFELALDAGADVPPDGAHPGADAALAHLLLDLDRPGRRALLSDLSEEFVGVPLGDYSALEVEGDDALRVLRDALRAALDTGQLSLRAPESPVVLIPLKDVAPLMPPVLRPQERIEEAKSTFEVVVHDEVDEPISGIELELRSRGQTFQAKTNAQGVATFKDVDGGVGRVRFKDPKQILDAVGQKWAEGRVPFKIPANIAAFRFDEKAMPEVELVAETPKLVIIRPELGRLDVRLREKSGRKSHALEQVKITGPVSMEGATDEEGRFRIEDLPPGDYEVELTQTFAEELKLDAVKHKSQLVVLGESQSGHQERWLGAVPRVEMARMRGLLFDTNKTFLLPTAIPSLQEIRSLYEARNPSKLLIVGHTDTTGKAADNDKLSKERADALHQFLIDDVDGWLKNYDQSDSKKKWGAREDRLMMTQLDGFLARPVTEPPVLWYQKHHNVRSEAKGRPQLKEDGIAGPKTRGELVRDYMALDGVTLSEQEGFLIEIETHGCGQNFPLDQTGLALDQRIASERDGERDRLDRRVEIFFFDADYGVRPEPTSAKGEEYLSWRHRSETLLDQDVAGMRQKATVVSVPSAHYRTGSAVLLPEGEAPTSGTGTALSSVGMLAMALRFNEERPGHSMLLAGHADSVGSDKSNDKLSTQRAELTHAVLTGNREKFVEIANETGKVSDWKQIFRWASAAVPGFEKASPTAIDENATSGKPAATAFQEAYNAQKTELGISGDDLKPDGVVGKKTWGAVFDLYQWNLADELGEVEDEADIEDATKRLDGLKKLQGMPTFLPTSKPFVGFGEHAPVDVPGKDNVASAANRRVELMFFEQGHEPDVAILNEAPEVSELYLPDEFEQATISMKTAKRLSYSIRLLDFALEPLANARCSIEFGAEIRSARSDGNGIVRFKTTERLARCVVSWFPIEGEELPVVREVTFDDSVQSRLSNLGYSDTEAEDDDAELCFLREFGLGEDMSETERHQAIIGWHDTGTKPSTGDA